MEFRERYREKVTTQLGRLVYYDTAGNVVADWLSGPNRTHIHRTKDWRKKTKDTLTGLTPTSPFESFKWTAKPGAINFYERIRGIKGPPSSITNWPCNVDFENTMPSPPGGWSYLEGSDTELVTKLLAETHPFKPKISIPVLVLELAEAATLLKLATQNLLALGGSSWLNYQFGWKQTIRDIKTLASITTSIEARVKLFNQLLEKGGSRVKAHLAASGSGAPWDGNHNILAMYGKFFYADKKYAFKTNVWGSVRWTPNRAKTVEIKQLTAFNEAAKKVLDLDLPSPSTMWEALPFSWLIDYFVNVGDALQAIEARDTLEPHDICIMRRRTMKIVYTPTIVPVSDDVFERTTRILPPQVYCEQKVRTTHNAPNTVFDLLSFRILSEGQLLNAIALLASLKRFK